MDTIIVVPCFNEAHRLRNDLFSSFIKRNPWVGFIFVDDGSSDDTPQLLSRMRRSNEEQVDILLLKKNGGKAEAVRKGMRAAFGKRPSFIGFWDADLSTPLESIGDLKQVFAEMPHVQWVIGSRVKLMGRHIERLPTRHYIGRIFATAASVVLRLPIYDTQCGAKLFRATPDLKAILQERFIANWMFDVELIARFSRRQSETRGLPAIRSIYEFPLKVWRHRRGTKIQLFDGLHSAVELYRIWRTII